MYYTTGDGFTMHGHTVYTVVLQVECLSCGVKANQHIPVVGWLQVGVVVSVSVTVVVTVAMWSLGGHPVA